MKKILNTRSPGGHYTAEMILFWCFDARFFGLFLSFLKRFSKRNGVIPVDPVLLAGGLHVLANGSAAEKKFALSQIAASVKLHHANRIGLMIHMECGKYGGSGQFKSRKAEVAHHVSELKAAAKTVKKYFPKLKIELFLADFDGLYKV